MDHLDEEAVRDSVERLRDVHLYGYCSARGLRWLKPETNRAEMGSRVGTMIVGVPFWLVRQCVRLSRRAYKLVIKKILIFFLGD